jgi:hypothetical protein
MLKNNINKIVVIFRANNLSAVFALTHLPEAPENPGQLKLERTSYKF